MNGKVPSEVSQILDAVAAESGLEVYHATTDGKVLAVQVDRAGGASVGLCAEFSRAVSARLDAANLMRGPHRIEVSSPGVERRLYRLRDFARAVGGYVRIRTRRGVLEGTIEAAGDDLISLKCKAGEETRVEAVPITDIRDAQLKVSDRELFATKSGQAVEGSSDEVDRQKAEAGRQ